MKQLYISTLLTLGLLKMSAQTPVTDTVSLGAGYANQVWYSLANDNAGTAPKNNWDLAFDCATYGTAIHINSVTGTQLWQYPAGDTAAWFSVDTTGITGWPALYNSDTSWSIGACNLNSSSSFDIGWGIYNPITHIVTGDSLYVIKLSNGSYHKLWIKQLAYGIYTVRTGTLTNSIDNTFSIYKSTYAGKNFVYYSLQNSNVIDREPASANWDLLFTQYTAFIPAPYTVAGVLHNNSTQSAELHQVNVSIASHGSAVFGTAINGIGYDWKQFAQNGWVIEDSLVYFVNTQAGDIWKLVFTGFGGSANGNFIFSKELVSAVSISDNQQTLPASSLWPNPAQDQFTLLRGNASAEAVIQIYDTSGRMVVQEGVQAGQGLHSFNILQWEAGIYQINIIQNNTRETLRLLIL